MDTPITCYNTEKLMSHNNKTFIEKMIHLFIKSANEYLSHMTMAVDEKNIVKINQLAHHIKPSIDLLSIHSITQSIRTIEQAAEVNHDLLQSIHFTHEQLKTVVQQMQSDYAS